MVKMLCPLVLQPGSANTDTDCRQWVLNHSINRTIMFWFLLFQIFIDNMLKYLRTGLKCKLFIIKKLKIQDGTVAARHILKGNKIGFISQITWIFKCSFMADVRMRNRECIGLVNLRLSLMKEGDSMRIRCRLFQFPTNVCCLVN